MKPKVRVAVMAKDSEARRVSKFFEPSHKLVSVSRSIHFPVSVDVVYRKKLIRMWATWFSVVVARTDHPTISHKCGDAAFLVVISLVLSLFFSPLRVYGVFLSIFSLEIIMAISIIASPYFTENKCFFRCTRLMRRGVSIDHIARAGTINRSFLFCLEGYFTSKAYMLKFLSTIFSYSCHWDTLLPRLQNVNTIGICR